MTDRERLVAENGRLRAELLRAQEDRAVMAERLAYALVELAELRKRVPNHAAPGGSARRQRQAAAPGGVRGVDPLERLFRGAETW